MANQYPSLRGAHVRLLPLALSHAEDLALAAADGALWNLWYTSVPKPDATLSYIEKALQARDAGEQIPFVVLDSQDKIVGCTRLYDIKAQHRRCKIGYTWYASRVQRSALNTEAKYLLLQYAFEQMNCIAIGLETHIANERSRAAIARIGAKQDGIIRNHEILADGSIRDTVVFSIINTEWPEVANKLLARLKLGD